MRKSVLKAAVDTPTHPSPGDVCLGCVHKPDPDGCHYFYMASGVGFKTTTGRAGSAYWMFLCEACFVKYAGNIKANIDSGSLQIGCDMVWPEDLQVTFVRPS